jgi:hypothetical protein
MHTHAGKLVHKQIRDHAKEKRALLRSVVVNRARVRRLPAPVQVGLAREPVPTVQVIGAAEAERVDGHAALDGLARQHLG